MNFEITGKLFLKNDTQVISDRFKKREFVLHINDPEYPQHIKFQLTQDKCSLLDKFNDGDEINVHFNVRGNKWEKGGETSYFINLDAWRIETMVSNNTQY